MQGFFDVQVKDACGLSDDAFRGLSGKELDRLLARLRTVQHAPWHKNLVNDMMAAWLFQHTMSGGGIGFPYDGGGVGGGGLANLILSQTDAEPGYQDSWNSSYVNMHEGQDAANTSSGGKRFYDDQVESHLITLTPAKEELYFRSRFLYTPSQGVSSNIRSIAYYYSDNADNTGDNDRGLFGRVRLKDSGGSPIVVNKTAAQVLLVQVIFKLVTI